MFSYILKKIHFSRLKSLNDRQACDFEKTTSGPIMQSLGENLENLRNILNNSSDIVVCEFDFGDNRKTKGALLYIDGMVDKDTLQKNVLQPLMYDALLLTEKSSVDLSDADIIYKNLLTACDKLKVALLRDMLDYLMTGCTILLIDGSEEALVINAKKWESRGVDEPETETIVRGPREGFTEDLRVNMTLLRRKIKNTDFCFEIMKIGEKTKTEVCIAYLKSIADPGLIKEIKARLQRIRTDAILESGYIEQFIEDAPYSIYPTIGNSEKPDKVAAKILEGRAAILVDGTPFVLTAPMLFIESLQTAEDYYSRTFFSSFIRMIRFISYIISIFSPAIYVALTVFHQELIPTKLLVSIAAGREPVPFPAVVEAGFMVVTFDILREAGVRLPRPVGSAVSIAGALVLGQSAVTAGLISPIMVIVVATTAISSFVVPAQTDSASILRYIYLALAGLAGGFGIIMGLLVNLTYITSVRSFGTPYFSPIAPLVFSDLKDTFIRMPLWTLNKRPRSITGRDSERQGIELAPLPEHGRSRSQKP